MTTDTYISDEMWVAHGKAFIETFKKLAAEGNKDAASIAIRHALEAIAPALVREGMERANRDARNAIGFMVNWPDDLPKWQDDFDDEEGVIGLAAYADDGMCLGLVTFQDGGKIIYAMVNPETGDAVKGNATDFDEAFEACASAIRAAKEEV